MKTFIASVKEKINLTPTVLMIKLALEENQEIEFKAGQHVILNIPSGESILERPLSIASPPYEKKHLEFLIKLIPGGVLSTFFEKADIGSEVILKGPKGQFSLKPTKNLICFIASSTGLAPFRSMVMNELKSEKRPKMHLVLGFPSIEEVFLRDELDSLSKGHYNFTYSLLETLSPNYTAQYLEDVNIKQKNNFYLCGGSNLLEDMKKALIQRGIEGHSIHYEEYK